MTVTREDAEPVPALGHKPAASQTGPAGAYLPALDGLRAFSIASVLLFHSGQGWAPGAFLAISLFFTLSGFLITSMLLRSHAAGGIDLRTFWARRLRRLMPAALTGLAGVVVFGATVADRNQAESLPEQMFAAATYWVNWLFVSTEVSYADLFSSPSPVQHFWSLSVEEQFYVVMPLGLFLLLRATKSLKVLAAVFGGGAMLSTVWSAHLWDGGTGLDRVYYGTDTRLTELLAGALLAVVLTRTGSVFPERVYRAVGAIGVVAFAVATWGVASASLDDGRWWQGGMLAFSLVSAALILCAVAGSGPVAWVLARRPMAMLGRVSYGVYVYHWPIYLWLTPRRTGLDPMQSLALRVTVTLLVAAASYHLIEMPIRDGARLRGGPRWAMVLVPALVVALVGATALTANRDGEDPLETLRASDTSGTPPVEASDGVLDLLIVTDEEADGVISRIEELDAADEALRVSARTPWGCSEVVDAGDGPSCVGWNSTWPDLIEEHDPDVVLVYVEGWSDDEVRRLAGPDEDDLASFTASVVGNGMDLLSAQGAPIVFAAPGASFGIDIKRSETAFFQAMAALEPRRDDLRHVLGGRLPEGDVVARDRFVRESAAALLTDASLYQRTDGGSLPRVLVVGDSQARSLGYGLERWGAQEQLALVWNIATEGCGVADDGIGRSGQVEAPVSDACLESIDAFPSRVAAFDPDLVIVLTSLWDLQERRVEGWDDFHGPGDATFDRYLVDEFVRVTDTFAAGDATVVWVAAPCIDDGRGEVDVIIGAGSLENIRRLNTVILPAVAERRPDVVERFDLDDVLCDDGRGRAEIDGISPIRTDGAHFSVDGSLWFASTYGPELLDLIDR